MSFPPPAPLHDTRTVLVVDDHESLRRLYRQFPEDAGHRVVEAQDGLDAMLRWNEEGGAVDILVTDLAMPNMGCRELAKAPHAMRPRASSRKRSRANGLARAMNQIALSRVSESSVERSACGGWPHYRKEGWVANDELLPRHAPKEWET